MRIRETETEEEEMTKKTSVRASVAITLNTKSSSDVFVWHGKDSKESAELLATELGGTAGTVPPKGFKGHLVCLSPGVSEKFKWEDREFAVVLNDPRKPYKKTGAELAEVVGVPARVYCASLEQGVGGGIKQSPVVRSFIRVNGAPEMTLVDDATRNLVRNYVIMLGEPNLVAFDGLLLGSAFIPTKVIYAPSLEATPLTRAAIKEMVPIKKAKDELLELVSGSTEEEAEALRVILRRLRDNPNLVETTA